ncbi:MAG: MATE family efflux transporter [Holophagales bacterium]|nr:MATE family efflux transporter [Holophagales bacterium]
MDSSDLSPSPSTGSRLLRRELSAVVRLATPVAATQLGMMAMGTVDSMMLGRVSETALAAGALGNAVSFALLVFGMGLIMALDPLVAQAHGARDKVAMARHVQRGAGLALFLSIPFALLMWDCAWLLRKLGQDASIVEPTAAYIRGIVPGIPGFLLFTVFRQTLQAMSLVRPAFWAILWANLVNGLANYVLIFGNWGSPALGELGSAYATSISRWVMLLLIFGGGAKVLKPLLSGLRRSAIDPRTYGPLLRLGLPLGFQISLELWLFSTVALLMGYLGARELAAHQIALSLAALSFMVPLGVAGAAATRVGNAIGRGDPEGARRAAMASLALGGAVMSISGLCFVLFPAALARLFTPELHVVSMAALLVPIAAAFQIFDGLQVVGAGVLRGAADTRIPAAIAFVGYWLLGLPLGLALGFEAGLGPRGLWWGLTLGLASVAVLFLLRIRVVLGRELSRYEE